MASLETVIYRPTLDGDEIEIEVEVGGRVEKYFAGSFDEPPSGGFVDDVAATFWDDQAKKIRHIPLTDEEIKTFSDQLVDHSVDDEQDAYEQAMEDRYDFEKENP